MKKSNINIICYTIYLVLYELLIWGLFGYIVFILHYSGWWMLLAAFLSASCLKPHTFGIKAEANPNPDKNNREE